MLFVKFDIVFEKIQIPDFCAPNFYRNKNLKFQILYCLTFYVPDFYYPNLNRPNFNISSFYVLSQ